MVTRPGNKPSSSKGSAVGSESSHHYGWEQLFAGAAGGCLGIALLKFGNPIIFESLIPQPGDLLEFIFQPWPISWGYAMVIAVAMLALKVSKLTKAVPPWILLLPLMWLTWQFVAATRTVDSQLTKVTLFHFIACVAWFYIGVFALSALQTSRPFWVGLLIGFSLVVWVGFEQHYGGLEATRKYFYEQPDWQQYPPEYLKKIASNRIFSTLVYPNALAGAILLLLPALVVAMWEFTGRIRLSFRQVSAGLLTYGGLACLYWSGSKAGWLVGLIVIAVVAFSQPFARKIRVGMLLIVLLLGTGSFFIRFADYFQRGATSVGARFGYWNAAWVTARSNPVFGTGPGTFAVPYRKMKTPEAEMARLVHNDYLEQASDSGIVGFLTYTAMIVGALWFIYPKQNGQALKMLMMRVGILAWVLQSLVEFSLYVPAIAWPAFTFLGWLVGAQARENESTRSGRSNYHPQPS
jgi:hypothetical protein